MINTHEFEHIIVEMSFHHGDTRVGLMPCFLRITYYNYTIIIKMLTALAPPTQK